MTASSATARLLSLLVLVLSLAPLGSMYILFLSFGGPAEQDAFHQSVDSGVAEKAQHTLAQVFKDPNATLEELWTALFLERQYPSLMSSPMLLEYLNFQGKSVHHLSLVLPWLFSFILGVVVPTTLSIYTFLKQRKRRGRGAGDREQRLKRILKKLQNYTTTLTDDDLVLQEVQQPLLSPLSRNDADDVATWKLPRAGVPLIPGAPQDKDSTRSIPGTCSICLNLYAVSEAVTWSTNQDCVHCFHENCIVSWLLRKNSKHRQCPCCRQQFVFSSKIVVANATTTTTDTTDTAATTAIVGQ